MSGRVDGASGKSPTAVTRTDSNKVQLQRRIASLIAGLTPSSTAGWTPLGFRPDMHLLSHVLALTDPADVRGGSVATGLDMWTAAMLRASGLRGVRPHASEPFFVSPLASEVAPIFGAIDKELRALEDIRLQLERAASGQFANQVRGLSRRLTAPVRRLRREIERGTLSVMGESRRKQVDVFLADWDRGLELLVSTKTFALAADPKDLVKNLPNRWEEFDGDLKNLRGRFPLAVIGASILLPSTTRREALPAFVDMMTKLTAPGRPWTNAYDRAAIVVVDSWHAGSTSHVSIRNDELGEAQLPLSLQPTTFFDNMIERLLVRAPIEEHRDARAARAAAKGEDPKVIERAASAVARAAETPPERMSE